MNPPVYPTGRNLLAGKTVLVTAAAGTGIGYAVARRAIEEGASVMLSDWHERRLSEAAARIADETGTARPAIQLCDVTDQAQVDALRDATADRIGPLDVLINNAGLGGEVAGHRHDRRPNGTACWIRHSDIGFPHDPCLSPGDVCAGQRRDRQQCIGTRLARAKGAGALCRGQGGRNGFHALLGA